MPKRLLFACVLLACSLAGALGSRAEELVVLARPGPWTAVSGLVGYGERLWFVNAELFVNHNSADVYSYDPRTGRARYEAHLFSQNAGLPAVAEGLLYWPFEDARSSAGRGEFMVTDGRDWAWHLLPERQVFHIHAMLGHRGTLFAATSAWRGGLQRSDDGGHSWRLLYEYPSPPRTVSRFTEETVKVFPASDPGSCIARTCYLYRQSKRPHRGSPPWPRDATRRCSPEAR